MKAAAAAMPCTLRRVGRLLGVPRATVAALQAAGFINPARGAGHLVPFSFQDLALLRAARSLRLAGLPTRKILRALAALRAGLPAARPLSAIRVAAIGAAVAVLDGGTAWEAESGQLLLRFDLPPGDAGPGRVERLARGQWGAGAQWGTGAWRRGAAPARACFDRALALEARDAAGAESAYRQAIRLNPRFA
ncbi:MAG: MerR family transcriptional regulator, partial [Burkholderiaceae bacterium]